MIAEALALIATTITIVQGITDILKNKRELESPDSQNPLSTSINTIEARISDVESVIKKIHQGSSEETALSEAYAALLKALLEDKNYSSRLEVIPTTHGTWKIVRKKPRKTTVLRDPEGEYAPLTIYIIPQS